MGKYKIFVDGSSGTTGLRIADRLAERDEFEILKILRGGPQGRPRTGGGHQ